MAHVLDEDRLEYVAWGVAATLEHVAEKLIDYLISTEKPWADHPSMIKEEVRHVNA